MKLWIPTRYGSKKMRMKESVKVLIKTWPSLLPLQKREADTHRVFCIGLPRSGTHSMAYVLSGACRSAHEAHVQSSLYMIMQWMENAISDQSMIEFISYRDRCLKLDFEASHFLHQVAHLTVDLFPSSKYIFTVRDPYSWLESSINQSIKSQDVSYWRAYEDAIYGPSTNFHFPVLDEYGAYPVRNYLSYWCRHIDKVMTHVPTERLLVVNTFNIDGQLEEISKFSGVCYEDLDIKRRHSGQRDKVNYPTISIKSDLDGHWISKQIQDVLSRELEFDNILRRHDLLNYP